MTDRLAICPTCQVPLIPTFAFRKKEFYCLECGVAREWLDTQLVDAPEVQAKYDELKAEWDENVAGKIITVGAWYSDDRCEKCGIHTPHDQHATEAEWEADREAREWLKERKR